MGTEGAFFSLSLQNHNKIIVLLILKLFLRMLKIVMHKSVLGVRLLYTFSFLKKKKTLIHLQFSLYQK